jgi:hypothetical protein
VAGARPRQLGIAAVRLDVSTVKILTKLFWRRFAPRESAESHRNRPARRRATPEQADGAATVSILPRGRAASES